MIWARTCLTPTGNVIPQDIKNELQPVIAATNQLTIRFNLIRFTGLHCGPFVYQKIFCYNTFLFNLFLKKLIPTFFSELYRTGHARKIIFPVKFIQRQLWAYTLSASCRQRRDRLFWTQIDRSCFDQRLLNGE